MEPEDVTVAPATERKDKEQETSTSIANNDSKNDWETAKNTTASEQNIAGVPTFIRVIVIRRILLNDMKHNIDNNNNNDKYIKHLMTYMTDLDDSMQSKMYKTLSQLVANNGIINYFNSWDEKDNNPNTIETIFNKLILTKFLNQYQDIITSKSKKNTKTFYQDLLFNMKDLMCTIFEYVDYHKELINCSLVCSHWLYYAYNTSLYTVNDNFTKLLLKTLEYGVKKNNDSSGLRMWQRLTKLKSIDIDLERREHATTQLLLDKLSTLKNVEKMDGSCKTKHFAIIKTVIKNCRENIKHYSVKLKFEWVEEDRFVLSQLVLPNAKHISMTSLYFYIIWFNKCQELKLDYLKIINKEWCNFVMKNCDCSNIQSLTFLKRNTRDENDFITTKENKENEQRKKLLRKLAQRFINLQHLSIDIEDCNDEIVLLFCQYLKDIINKNNVEIELAFYDDGSELFYYNKTIEWIKQLDIACKIYKLLFCLGQFNDNQTFEEIETLLMLSCSNVEWIEFIHSMFATHVHDSTVDCVSQTAFKSLKVFKYSGWDFTIATFESVNKILEMVIDKIKKGKFYFIAYFYVGSGEPPNCNDVFDTFCQKIVNLMIKYETPIDVAVKIPGKYGQSKLNENYNDTYLSYFNEQSIFKDYKPPQCNKYCVPLLTPRMSFTWNNRQCYSEFMVKSATKQNSS